jgi:hypothetical protein
MADRQVTFIDTDDNSLIVRFKADRIQLVVVDSEPELDGAELRGFASAVFAAYVGGPLAERLAASRIKIDLVRDELARRGAHELVAALDGSLRVIADIADAMTATTAAVAVPPATDDDHADELGTWTFGTGARTRRPRLSDGEPLEWRARYAAR